MTAAFLSSLQWQNRTFRTEKMSKQEEEFWRLERYAYRWPPPWLSKMQNESNPVVFLDIAIRSLDRCYLACCMHSQLSADKLGAL